MSVCIILKLNPDELTFVLGGEMAMWTDDYCFVDQCFLYKRGKPYLTRSGCLDPKAIHSLLGQ